jgi:pyruvate/2-oxoglutarate dehydrogenase complex dihydrolipoamide dehydrogenase (E3) component
MLAGTLVYVNAGTHLAKISGLNSIISPGMLVSFTLLGVFPLFAKWFLHYLQRRRVYAKWKRPKNFDRNLIVIGAGAAGLVTAYIGAVVKAKVTLIEAQKMGGDCLNYGCVPSKALIKSARLAHQMNHGDNYGLKAVAPEFSFNNVMARVHEVIRTVAPHDSVERYTELGVEVLKGYAKIQDPWSVEVKLDNGDIKHLTTRNIVIATGARPVVPSLPGLEDVGYVTSDTLWDEFAKKDKLPPRLIVLGGGPIGCELAQSFARLGSKVTQIQRSPRIMIREDEEVSEIIQSSLEQDGVHILTDHRALHCERDGNHKFITVTHDGTEQRIEFDELLCAVGRKAQITGYGLEELGIETQNTVVTNEYLETLYPNIFAAGDVVGPFQFTHTASHQAWYAAVNALFGDIKKFKVDYSIIPRATFVDPEVARVGLNEQEAKRQGVPYETTRYKFDDLDRAIADSSTNGFIKVLTVPGKDRILGATIVGEHAGDLLAEFVLAMKHGLGLSKILGTIHTYPTLAEANKYVAGVWKKDHAPQRVLTWLFRYHSWKR